MSYNQFLNYFQSTFERLQRSLDAGFKSSHLPARMACLHSMLYLLQVDDPALDRDVISGLLPMTTEYLKMYLKHTSVSGLCHSEDHVTLMWALAFYILEFKHEHIEQVKNNRTNLQQFQDSYWL